MRAKLFRDVPFARTGRQHYAASELGVGDSGFVAVDREHDEVAASASTFEGTPVTLDHPCELMDADAVERLAVGMASDVVFDSHTGQLRADLLVWNERAIRTVRDGIRELSAGYTAEYLQDGAGYRQTNIKGNHIALVAQGRAGTAQRIGGS